MADCIACGKLLTAGMDSQRGPLIRDCTLKVGMLRIQTARMLWLCDCNARTRFNRRSGPLRRLGLRFILAAAGSLRHFQPQSPLTQL